MNTIITVIHIVGAFSLILTVLLQAARVQQWVLGLVVVAAKPCLAVVGRQFLTKLTTGIAILFMVTSLTLATFSNNKKSSSVIQGIEETLPNEASEPKGLPDNSTN